MTIELTAEIEAKLMAQAQFRGVEPAEYVKQVLERELSRPPADDKTLELLAQWDREDATDDPAEIARRCAETEQFMQNLARNRVEMEGPNARKLWP